MRRFAVLILGLCGFAAPAFAQFTTVTATVTDPSGIPYAGAVMNAILVPGASGGYTLGGQPYSGRVGPVTLDSGGKFTAQFGDVTLITPGSPQWQITIDSAASTVQLPLGTGPQSFTFTSTGTTISGSSPVSLTSALNALAPKLTNFAVGGTVTTTGTPVANQVAEFSSATAITGAARFTDNGTTLSYTGSGGLSVTGGPSTFNNAAGSGALDIIFGILNRMYGSCGNGSGYRFTTIESGNSDILTNSTQGGYNLICPDNATDTMTSQDEIGSNTKIVVDQLHPGNVWTSNFTSSAPYLWGVHNGSGITGAQNGTRGSTPGARTGGAYLYYPCNANTTNGLTTAEGLSTIQAYGMVQHLSVEACNTGTVGAGSPSVALCNWEGISSLNTFGDNYCFGAANTVLCRFASNNVGGNAELLGPLYIFNTWCNGLNHTGAQAWKVTTTPGSCSAILAMTIAGGVANDSGSSLPNFEVNGQGCPGGTIRAGLLEGMHAENLNAALTPIDFKIEDTRNWMFEATDAHNASTSETGFDFSQSGAGLTCAISTFHNYFDNNGITTISNHISGFSQTGQGIVQGYIFGGDGSCNIYPWIYDSQSVELLNSSVRSSFFDIYKTTDPTTNFTRFRIDNSQSGTAAVVLSTRHGGTGNLSAITLDPDSGNVNFLTNGTNFLQISSGSNAVKCLSAGRCDLGTGTSGQGIGSLYFSENAAPAGAAAADIVWGDSTSHLLKANQNNAGAVTIMTTGQNSAQKTQRFGASCTTAASAAATCTSTFSWTTAFADANYTPVCWGEGPAGSPIISLNATQVAASVTVQVQAATAVASSFAGVYCHAVHD